MTRNDFGRIFLIEDCEKIEMRQVLKAVKMRLKEALLEQALSGKGWEVSLSVSETGNGGRRYWMGCPLCERRCATLYRHPVAEVIGCRHCLGLRYKKCAKKGMPESI